jgi:AcrR family transcriptional regulator
MTRPTPAPLEPRKQPLQARSKVTVDAIFEATIQVLLRDGTQRLTTTRVAERAGVSVGTLYQYYPNKQALLYGVLQRHLVRIGNAVEEAACSAHQAPLAAMTRTVVNAFVSAKTSRIDEARALYRVASEIDSMELVKSVEARCTSAIADMLETASDARFANLPLVAFMFSAAIVGPTRAMLEGGAPPHMLEALPDQLESLCLGYLRREDMAHKVA